jgi:hypothetical protein
MAQKRETEKRERAYTGPTCAAYMDRATADGSRTCNLPAYQTINGLPMCDGHAAIERRKAEAVREVQAQARKWLAAQGATTPAQVRELAHRLKRMLPRDPGKDWAIRLRDQEAAGKTLTATQAKLWREELA